MSDYKKIFHDLMNRYSVTFGQARVLALSLEKSGDFEGRDKVIALSQKLLNTLKDTNESTKVLRDAMLEDLKL